MWKQARTSSQQMRMTGNLYIPADSISFSFILRIFTVDPYCIFSHAHMPNTRPCASPCSLITLAYLEAGGGCYGPCSTGASGAGRIPGLGADSCLWDSTDRMC